MKIRTQLQLLILFMVLVPIVCVISLPLFQYLNSPQRYLLGGYKVVRKLEGLDISADDMDKLGEQLKRIPSNIETMVYYNSTVLISSVPEVKVGTVMTPIELFDFLRTTSDRYDYQLQSLGTRPTRRLEESVLNPMDILIVCRAKVFRQRMVKDNRRGSLRFLLYPGVATLVIFEIVCAIFLINLSKTITDSITVLEETTQKIAMGELDTKITTSRKGRNANEITSLAESLEKMRASLKDSQDRRTKFIMGISHDLRTPVALIKGYTEAITDGVVTDMDKVKGSLAIIHTKADQLEGMINDLINYVKLNNTDWRQSLEYVKLKPVLDEFKNSAEATAEVYKRAIRTSVEVSCDTRIKMDKNLLSRALENIYSNALRYTKDGDSISIEAKEVEDAITICIADTGIGIGEKDLKRIWDIFYRGTNSRREGGMGIGLSVVRTIIDTHGWNIDVQSKPGEGTAFTITIPKEAGPAEQA